MAKKSGSETFMADAERLLRQEFGPDSNLVVWRGQYPNKYMGTDYHYDTIVVGMADGKTSTEPPPLVIYKVWLQDRGGAHYDFSVGSEHDVSGNCPFGGGWVPLEHCVKELIPRLKEVAK